MFSRNRRIAVFVGFILVCVSTSLTAEDQHKWGKVTQEDWSVAAPTAFPEAAAVVIFDIGKVDVPAPYGNNLSQTS